MNLIEDLQEEMNRCREILKLYEAIPTGVFGATMIKVEISNTEAAIASGDAVEMLKCYKTLKNIEA